MPLSMGAELESFPMVEADVGRGATTRIDVQSRNILIVDDEPSIRGMLAFTLTRGGYRYCEAPDAGLARKQLAQRRPGLILLDWMLPDMSGLAYHLGRWPDPGAADHMR